MRRGRGKEGVKRGRVLPSLSTSVRHKEKDKKERKEGKRPQKPLFVAVRGKRKGKEKKKEKKREENPLLHARPQKSWKGGGKRGEARKKQQPYYD